MRYLDFLKRLIPFFNFSVFVNEFWFNIASSGIVVVVTSSNNPAVAVVFVVVVVMYVHQKHKPYI